MVVAIVGSRTFRDAALIRLVVAGLREEFGERLEIVSGGADGADTLAIATARDLGIARAKGIPARVFHEGRWTDE